MVSGADMRRHALMGALPADVHPDDAANYVAMLSALGSLQQLADMGAQDLVLATGMPPRW